ncbi:MAG: c-type cytochrome [Proteobacteria bacterium]|nr:c-type cytochrome [Pseudomonadota bacterium]
MTIRSSRAAGLRPVLKALAVLSGAVFLGAALTVSALAHDGPDHAKPPAAKPKAAVKQSAAKKDPAKKGKAHEPANVRLAMPMMNAERGMYLFASKGCVACHAVNGIGGHDAKNLDAHTMEKVMNPFDFVAKMWRVAPAMIYAQQEVYGDQILFTGEEIADIIAFVHDDEQQHKFNATMIPSKIMKLMGHVHDPKPAHQKELGHKPGTRRPR